MKFQPRLDLPDGHGLVGDGALSHFDLLETVVGSVFAPYVSVCTQDGAREDDEDDEDLHHLSHYDSLMD